MAKQTPKKRQSGGRSRTAENAKQFAALRKKGQRLQSIDCIRGLSICLMVGHHFFFDLVEFAEAPTLLFYNPVFEFLEVIFAGCFVVLCGLSCKLSRSNLKRGLLALGAAMVITVVTYTMDHYAGTRLLISFGFLHMLACCILIFAGIGRWLDRIPRKVAPFLYIALGIITWKLFYMRFVGDIQWLFPLGMIGWDFYWADYCPLFPWLFVFLFGTWLGDYLVEGRFPQWFYTFRFPLLAWFGRQTMVIYLVHQPVLYGLTLLIIHLMN